MSEHPLSGAARDPIALLEQLIGLVGDLKIQMDEFRQDLVEVKQELGEIRQQLGEIKQDLGQVKQDLGQFRQDVNARFDGLEAEVGLIPSDVTAVRSDMVRFATAVSKEQESFKGNVEAVLDRRNWMARHEWQEKHAEIERRVAELEAAERRRKEGQGA